MSARSGGVIRVYSLRWVPTLKGSAPNSVHSIFAGEWELRATSRGLSRVILPTRVGSVFAEDSVVSSLDSHVDAGRGDESRPFPQVEGMRLALAHLRTAATQIDEYLAGNRRNFTVPLAPAPVTSFQACVHQAIAHIPFGCTWSYGDLAAAIGAPKAGRAVGSACGANPLPVIVPCHRVIRSDGSLGYYTGGTEYKRALLALEGHWLED